MGIILSTIVLGFQLFWGFQAPCFAMGKEEFLRLSENERFLFLTDHATEFFDAPTLQAFQSTRADFVNVLSDAGSDTANIWWDTILEGPYALAGVARTQLVSVYIYKGEVYAVKGRVSADGLFVDSCEYDEVTGYRGKDCVQGTIEELFVLDVSGQKIDFGYFADFVE